MKRFLLLFLLSAAAGTQAAEAGLTLQDLDQRLKIAERKLELAAEANEAAKQGDASVSAGSGGFSLQSADKKYSLKSGGLLQADARVFTGDNLKPATNEILIRRARLQLDPQVGERMKLRFLVELAGASASLVDAYAEIKLGAGFSAKLGRFKTPFSLERWRSDPDRDFVELGLSGGLVTDRDQGLLLEWADADAVAGLTAGVVNGGVDGTAPISDNEDDKDAFGRLFLHPFRLIDGSSLRNFGLGVAGSSGHRSGLAALPTYKSPGQATIFTYASGTTITGQAWRIAPQTYLFWRNFSLLGELVKSETQIQRANAAPGLSEAWIHHDAWQVQGVWVLTGEDTGFKGVKLGPESASWGSLALTGRYEAQHFDAETFHQTGASRFADLKSSISAASSWTAGLAYIPFNNAKLLIDWTETTYTDGASKAGLQADRETERVLFSRAQFTF